MRFSILSAIVLSAATCMVSASPVENSLELSSSHLLSRDVEAVDGKYFDEESHLDSRAVSKVSYWYLTKCNFYCPCGWYYYPQNNCANRRCYDNGKVGCRGKCPKATIKRGTCN